MNCAGRPGLDPYLSRVFGVAWLPDNRGAESSGIVDWLETLFALAIDQIDEGVLRLGWIRGDHHECGGDCDGGEKPIVSSRRRSLNKLVEELFAGLPDSDDFTGIFLRAG
jgi:hypothetical protein